MSSPEGLTEVAHMLADGTITAHIGSTVELGGVGQLLEKLRKGGLRGEAVIRLWGERFAWMPSIRSNQLSQNETFLKINYARKLGMRFDASLVPISDLCELDRTYIGGIERGERNFALVNIQKIARVLRIPISELFRGL